MAMPQRPNILLITTDQQRGDALGLETPALQTPNLDYLARDGFHFRRGYTPVPSCIPARRSLMTGMSAAAQGMTAMRHADWEPSFTLPALLSDAGYESALVGKSHLHPERRRMGFDHMVWSDGPHVPGDAYSRWLHDVHGRREHDAGATHGIDVNGWVGRANNLPEDQCHTYWLTSEAIDFLQLQRDVSCPFFLHLSIFDPHPPCAPPAFYYDRYDRRELPAPVIGDWADDWPEPQRGLNPAAWRIRLDEHQMHCCRAAYYGTVNFVDDQLGRLFQYMKRTGLWTNTIIVFSSDHGEMLGDHNLYRKCWPYDASARVPFIIWAPGDLRWSAPRAIDGPVGLQDIMPTLLDVAGVDVPEACTGRSLLPVLRGESDRVREVYHGEHGGQYEMRDAVHWLVDDRYKYVWYSQRKEEHLFDLREDPDEAVDLARRADGEQQVGPWREKLVEILRDRPEGFVEDGQLVRGRPHGFLVPGYEPDRFFPYL